MAVSLQDVLSNFLYIGGLKKESNPKTRQYWLDEVSEVNGLTVLDPEVVIQQLEKAKEKIQKAREAKKNILIVCQKSMYSTEVTSLSEKYNYHYLTYKVPSGFVTNFDTLIKRIENMNTLKRFVLSEEFAQLTKKEQLMKKRELIRVEKVYEWVKSLKKKPDLVVVVDGEFMSGIVDELALAKIDNVVVTWTNFSKRRPEDNVIATNVQSHKAVDFVMQYILS